MQMISDNNLTATIEDGKVKLPFVSKKMIAGITQQLIKADVEVYEIGIIKNDLETIFMNLINN
jgi:lantibiotic transport system ATP-binding protein